MWNSEVEVDARGAFSETKKEALLGSAGSGELRD